MIGNLQGLKDYLGILDDGQDARLTVALGRGSDLTKRFCRRDLEEATYTDELYDGTGTDTLNLKNFPLTAVSSVKEDGRTLTIGTNPASGNYDVLWYADEGQLVRPSGRWIPLRRLYAVTYTAGYTASTMPEIVVQAAYEYAALVNVEKDRVGIQNKTAGQQTTEYLRGLPGHIKDGLQYYVDRGMAMGRL